MDESLIRKIYQKLGDDVSKSIFSRRLMYSLTGDSRFIREMALDMPEGKRFYRLLDMAKHAGLVIFGAGTWGADLYRATKDYPWKCFVDSNPRVDKSEGLPVTSYREFIRNYQNETVVISSRLYYKSMYAQLMQSGIKPDRIINAGSMLDELSRKQYFDLEELKPQEDEVFIDAGGFDGMTSVYFQKWYLESGRGIKPFVYVFEPDRKNAAKCRKNLALHQVEHEIIEKGCWKEETCLGFQAAANGTSRIMPLGEASIEAVSIDEAVKGKAATFIKMDIEGSEAEALAGAEKTIRKNSPKLAVSIYHRPEDIWKLPERIMEYGPDYRFYLRHYSLTDYETVLYAVTKKDL